MQHQKKKNSNSQIKKATSFMNRMKKLFLLGIIGVFMFFASLLSLFGIIFRNQAFVYESGRKQEWATYIYSVTPLLPPYTITLSENALTLPRIQFKFNRTNKPFLPVTVLDSNKIELFTMYPNESHWNYCPTKTTIRTGNYYLDMVLKNADNSVIDLRNSTNQKNYEEFGYRQGKWERFSAVDPQLSSFEFRSQFDYMLTSLGGFSAYYMLKQQPILYRKQTVYPWSIYLKHNNILYAVSINSFHKPGNLINYPTKGKYAPVNNNQQPDNGCGDLIEF